MLSISIDRTALSLAALVIGDTPATGLWVPPDGVGRPAKTWRTASASSNFTHGEVPTRAVLEQSAQLLTVHAEAASTSALHALQDELEAAVFQFVYDVTVTEDGQARTWTCYPADVAWSDITPGMVAARLSTATLTIPCYPVGA
jgi:hypothetical protein